MEAGWPVRYAGGFLTRHRHPGDAFEFDREKRIARYSYAR